MAMTIDGEKAVAAVVDAAENVKTISGELTAYLNFEVVIYRAAAIGAGIYTYRKVNKEIEENTYQNTVSSFVFRKVFSVAAGVVVGCITGNILMSVLPSMPLAFASCKI